MTSGLVVDLDDRSAAPLSRVKVALMVSGAVLTVVVGFVLFWKYYFCPGPLGFFSWFRCECAANASRIERRCTCSDYFNGRGSSCRACGDVGQPCCDRNDERTLRCKYTADFERQYLCDPGGVCR